MDAMKQRIDELADLMSEYGLSQAELKGDGWKVAFKKTTAKTVAVEEDFHESGEPIAVGHQGHAAAAPPPAPAPTGTPVSSPMTGIYYSAPSPSAPPFVKPGESVTAGQVVGLIEAMKVFNEITSPVSGRVDRMVAENGQLVQPGDALLYIA